MQILHPLIVHSMLRSVLITCCFKTEILYDEGIGCFMLKRHVKHAACLKHPASNSGPERLLTNYKIAT